MDLPINGKTVSWVREQISEAFQIPSEATAFVDGNRVDEDFVLEKGQMLEFTDERKAKQRPDDPSETPES